MYHPRVIIVHKLFPVIITAINTIFKPNQLYTYLHQFIILTVHLSNGEYYFVLLRRTSVSHTTSLDLTHSTEKTDFRSAFLKMNKCSFQPSAIKPTFTSRTRFKTHSVTNRWLWLLLSVRLRTFQVSYKSGKKWSHQRGQQLSNAGLMHSCAMHFGESENGSRKCLLCWILVWSVEITACRVGG